MGNIGPYRTQSEYNSDSRETIVDVYCGNELIFAKSVHSLVIYSEVSHSGKLLALSTSFGPDKDDGKIFLFDTATGREIFSKPFEFGFLQKIRFNEDDELFASNSFGEYKLDDRGHIVDIDKAYFDIITSNDGNSLSFIYPYLERNNYSPESIKLAIFSISNLISVLSQKYNDTYLGARAYRIRGELFEKNNDLANAVNDFTDALFLDEKIGVKRKLSSLKKKLGLMNVESLPSERAIEIFENGKKIDRINQEEQAKAWAKLYELAEIKASEEQKNKEKKPKNKSELHQSKRKVFEYIVLIFKTLGVFLVFLTIKPCFFILKGIKKTLLKTTLFTFKILKIIILFILMIALLSLFIK
ncbi:hypothetical protein Q7Z29_09445 [Glaesserella parasuis]|nr:hypothetical protein [Glaesserella parasuis]MDP0351255.1 hypothetical protein [Glaesserella parasuis]